MNTEPGALKHTHPTGRRTQVHMNTEAGALKHTHTHTHRQTPVLVLTTDRTGIGTKWANVQTQAHTHHMHAHSST